MMTADRGDAVGEIGRLVCSDRSWATLYKIRHTPARGAPDSRQVAPLQSNRYRHSDGSAEGQSKSIAECIH